MGRVEVSLLREAFLEGAWAGGRMSGSKSRDADWFERHLEAAL